MKKKRGPVVYVGPTFRELGLMTYGVYEEGAPSAYAAHPIYQHLFVPPERLNDARREISRTGSALNVFYKKALTEHKEKKGGK